MDIVDDLRKDPYEEERQYKREARLELGGILDKAANEIERLREALAFYAEWGIDAPAVDAIIEEDRGDKARAALNIVLGEEE
ncbi:hypothetical protein UFOVP1459_44 [uncultured Caudovirales phage]|uniref:Uncharacterized protein n=1 Tax=uncultured Caudovirales phage TaxID=2100421 RepID=A0A6J5STL7_9CAUD|nr:hypothetical protein UFOVP1459_44 [uncultured Caudovirales phage]CAB4218406.1 hypothetical protein UFOVP1609_18 [uncultured Caudovirales phage]